MSDKIICLSVTALLLASPAFAEGPEIRVNECYQLGLLAEAVNTQYGEVFAAGGESDTGETTTVIFANPDTGTFTIIEAAGTIGCVKLTGQKWQVARRPA
jgi:hypothetical protein